MFCHKCGTKAIDGADFCQKCGAKLVVDNTVQPKLASPVPQAQSQANTPQQPKKISKKLSIILGAVVLAVIVVAAAAIVFITQSSKNQIDYVATVRAYKPFSGSQELPYTCGEVFDKYIPNAEWDVRKSDDEVFVDISGTATGADSELIITIRVETEGDRAVMKPVSVKLDGEEPDEDVFFALFVAYDEKDDDLSHLDELISEVDFALRGGKLTGTFTDEIAGISFSYPDWWVSLDPTSEYEIVKMISPRNNGSHIASFSVTISLDPDPFGVFTGNEAFVKDSVNGSHTFLDYGDVMLGDLPAKALRYQTAGSNGDDIVVALGYTVSGNTYWVTCSYAGSTSAIYENIFLAIMDSYTVTAAETGGMLSSEAQRAYADKVRELAAENNDLRFALIDLTQNDTPELVADYDGYYICIFAWQDGEVITIADCMAYGLMGNHGYQYIPGKNVIRNSYSDQAGAISYEAYSRVNDQNEIEAIPEDVYFSHQISGDFESLSGDRSAGEMLAVLDGNYKTPLNATSMELYYKNVSLTNWIGATVEDVYRAFGQPDDSTDMGWGTLDFSYGGDEHIKFNIDIQTDRISWIVGGADAINCNGVTLNKTQDELIAILGIPASEGRYYYEDGSNCYTIKYYINGTGVYIDMSDITGKAETISIWPS